MTRVRWIDRLVKRTVVVHMTTGASIRGVMSGTYRDSIVLAHATYLGMVGGDRVETPIDGDAVILREQVAWIQNLGESA
jgi:hypothetical protein